MEWINLSTSFSKLWNKYRTRIRDGNKTMLYDEYNHYKDYIKYTYDKAYFRNNIKSLKLKLFIKRLTPKK